MTGAVERCVHYKHAIGVRDENYIPEEWRLYTVKDPGNALRGVLISTWNGSFHVNFEKSNQVQNT